MSTTPDSTLANPEHLIADLQRQLTECKAERDEAHRQLAETATERDEALAINSMQDWPNAVAGLPLGPLQRDLMEAHLSRDTAEDKRQSAIADQRLTPADGIIDHPSGMLTANYAPVDT